MELVGGESFMNGAYQKFFLPRVAWGTWSVMGLFYNKIECFFYTVKNWDQPKTDAPEPNISLETGKNVINILDMCWTKPFKPV